MANQDAVLVIAQIIVQIAAAKKKLLADDKTLDLIFGNFSRLRRRSGRSTLRDCGGWLRRRRRGLVFGGSGRRCWLVFCGCCGLVLLRRRSRLRGHLWVLAGGRPLRGRRLRGRLGVLSGRRRLLSCRLRLVSGRLPGGGRLLCDDRSWSG